MTPRWKSHVYRSTATFRGQAVFRGATPPRKFSGWARPAGLGPLAAAEVYSLMAVSSPDLNAFLLATPFFGGLSDASLDLLVSMLVERRFDAGATVVAEGEPGRSMFVVHSGTRHSHDRPRAR
jgi:hypothetical protein